MLQLPEKLRSLQVRGGRSFDLGLHISDISVHRGSFDLARPLTTNTTDLRKDTCAVLLELEFREESQRELKQKENRSESRALRHRTRAIGLGEVAPLPGFSSESFHEAYAQTKALVVFLKGAKLTFLPSINQEDWIKDIINTHKDPSLRNADFSATDANIYDRIELVDKLYPSVRSGIEQALLVAISSATQLSICDLLINAIMSNPSKPCLSNNRASKLPIPNTSDNSDFYISDVSNDISDTPSSIIVGLPTEPLHVNALLASQGDTNAAISEAMDRVKTGQCSCLKAKVGRRINSTLDGKIISTIANALNDSNMFSLRADSNRAWDLAEAMKFANALTPSSRRKLEFVEEPCKDVHQSIEFSKRSGIPIALDESIDEGFLGEEYAATYMQHVSAIILKPTILGGALNCLNLAMASQKIRVVKPVISSAFETPYTLAYFAEIAQALNRCMDSNHAHGIGTSIWYDTETESDAVRTTSNVARTTNDRSSTDADGATNIDFANPATASEDASNRAAGLTPSGSLNSVRATIGNVLAPMASERLREALRGAQWRRQPRSSFCLDDHNGGLMRNEELRIQRMECCREDVHVSNSGETAVATLLPHPLFEVVGSVGAEVAGQVLTARSRAQRGANCHGGCDA